MSQIHVLTVVGARPQFVKACVVSEALRASGEFRETLIHTGQHYDAQLSDQLFADLDMREPDENLNVGSGKHGEQTGRMLQALESAIESHRPDWVLVYGDTNSTLAGALAAVKLHVPVAHVEAGLRSYNRRMPEEINRVVVDHVSELLLAPTEDAERILWSEGIPPEQVVNIGDVMYDAALRFASKADRTSRVLEEFGLVGEPYALVTTHRAENVDDPARLSVLMQALNQVAEQLTVVLPLHPRTASRLDSIAWIKHPRLQLIPPVGYLDMVQLEKHASVIATDSGGVQKEAYFYSVPCVTLRSETEWRELLELGWNRLAPPDDPGAVAHAILSAIGSRGIAASPYGDGHAAEKAVAALLRASKVPAATRSGRSEARHRVS